MDAILGIMGIVIKLLIDIFIFSWIGWLIVGTFVVKIICYFIQEGIEKIKSKK